MKWLEQGGRNATLQCKLQTARYFCLEVFPPCFSHTNYSVFPCRETCDELYQVCGKFVTKECPLDGPYMNSTNLADGTHYNSNNDLQSCFLMDSSIQPYPLYLCFPPSLSSRSASIPELSARMVAHSIPNVQECSLSFFVPPSVSVHPVLVLTALPVLLMLIVPIHSSPLLLLLIFSSAATPYASPTISST